MFSSRRKKNGTADLNAFLDASQLALDKHDFKLAADTFRAALKKISRRPRHRSRFGRLFSNRRPRRNDESPPRCFVRQRAPHSGLLLLADHLIDAEQYSDADEQLSEVLKVNPHHPEALAYRSVLAELRNDTNAAKAIPA